MQPRTWMSTGSFSISHSQSTLLSLTSVVLKRSYVFGEHFDLLDWELRPSKSIQLFQSVQKWGLLDLLKSVLDICTTHSIAWCQNCYRNTFCFPRLHGGNILALESRTVDFCFLPTSYKTIPYNLFYYPNWKKHNMDFWRLDQKTASWMCLFQMIFSYCSYNTSYSQVVLRWLFFFFTISSRGYWLFIKYTGNCSNSSFAAVVHWLNSALPTTAAHQSTRRFSKCFHKQGPSWAYRLKYQAHTVASIQLTTLKGCM